MERLLLTNCPNCAAPLEKDGTCKYCNTKARYANEIDLEAGRFGHDKIEILLTIKHGDETVLYPFVGRMVSMELEYSPYTTPGVEIIFNGHLGHLNNLQ